MVKKVKEECDCDAVANNIKNLKKDGGLLNITDDGSFLRI